MSLVDNDYMPKVRVILTFYSCVLIIILVELPDTWNNSSHCAAENMKMHSVVCEIRRNPMFY